jgi:hypothetical protein
MQVDALKTFTHIYMKQAVQKGSDSLPYWFHSVDPMALAARPSIPICSLLV